MRNPLPWLDCEGVTRLVLVTRHVPVMYNNVNTKEIDSSFSFVISSLIGIIHLLGNIGCLQICSDVNLSIIYIYVVFVYELCHHRLTPAKIVGILPLTSVLFSFRLMLSPSLVFLWSNLTIN